MNDMIITMLALSIACTVFSFIVVFLTLRSQQLELRRISFLAGCSAEMNSLSLPMSKIYLQKQIKLAIEKDEYEEAKALKEIVRRMDEFAKRVGDE